MRLALRNRLEQSLGASITSIQPLAGGCLSSCVRLRLGKTLGANKKAARDGVPEVARDVVVKFGAGHFLLEARMLAELADALSSFQADISTELGNNEPSSSSSSSPSLSHSSPFCHIPRVYHADADMLAMEWIEQERGASGSPKHYQSGHYQSGKNYENASYQAGCLLARLHACSSDSFGYDYDTPLGDLLQDNRRCGSWTQFYRERRLLPLAAKCLAAGELDEDLHKSLLRFTEKLDTLLVDRQSLRPSLLHGDLWGGNMLFGKVSLRALLDPALYYGDGQVDLAMLRLFPCCSESFFDGYRATSDDSLDRASESLYQEIYSIYPLLVHCLFFGRRYQSPLARVLHRYL